MATAVPSHALDTPIKLIGIQSSGGTLITPPTLFRISRHEESARRRMAHKIQNRPDIEASLSLAAVPAVRMLSLDVFGTALTRLTGSPLSLFLLLGRHLAATGLLTVSPEAFARARIAADLRCRQNIPHQEVTLEEIYVELARGLRLSATESRRVLEEELSIERCLLRPVPRTVDLVQRARHIGLPVAFLEDTYFPSTYVRDSLRNHGLYREGDTLYTSSSTRHTKQEGSLFRHLLALSSLPADQVLHRGNDLHADVVSPRSVGIRTSHFSEGNLNRYETIWESHAWATEGLSSLLAGTSRLTRLALPVDSSRDRVLRDVAAGVAGPTLVGYVLWILQQAQQRRLRRLYFVSRDGEILLAIARKLAERLNLDCDLVYLYGSRQAWHLPSVAAFDDSVRDWLLIHHDYLSINQLLRRVGLAPADVEPTLEWLGYDLSQCSRNLSGDERRRLQTIFEDPRFQRAVLGAAEQRRTAAVEYFRQVGLLDSTPWGIVDIGWAGMIQRSLGRILAMAGREDPPVGFYYGLTSGGSDPSCGVWETYMFDHRTRSGFAPWNGIVAFPLVGIFCEGQEGEVLEYTIGSDGRAEPVLREKWNQPALDWGLPIVQATILQFAETLPLDTSLSNPAADVRAATAAVLGTFWHAPTAEEARVWGAFPYEVEQGGGPIHPLAQVYSWKDLLRGLRNGSLPRHHVASWHAGALAMSPTPVQVALRLARGTRSRVRSLVRTFARNIVA